MRKKKVKLIRKGLEKTIIETGFQNLKDLEKNFGFNEKQSRTVNFFNQGKSNDWKKILPDKISLKIEKKFKKEMKELGYL